MSELHALNNLYKIRRKGIAEVLVLYKRHRISKSKAVDKVLTIDDLMTTEMIAEQDEEIDALNKRVKELEGQLSRAHRTFNTTTAEHNQ